jgi:hypothetical protein
MSSSSIRVYNAAMDVDEDRDSIILRGVLDASSLRHLQVADYQREIMPLASIAKLADAYKTGTVPDGELGMRGDAVRERNGAMYLHDPVYIIDGLQRVTAAMHAAQQYDIVPRFGATIHLNTNEEWERERFKILNSNRSAVSPNVMLRNMRYDHPSLEMLYALSKENKRFVLHDRVSWNQRMSRTELLTARSLLLSTTFLHQHVSHARSSSIQAASYALDRIMDKIGMHTLRTNILTFYSFVDNAWGVRTVAYRSTASYMRQTFLQMLGQVFARHTNFWDGSKLVIPAPLARKISTYPVYDPWVVQMASASGKSRDALYLDMVDHINKGKRTGKLQARDYMPPVEVDPDPLPPDGDDEEDEVEPHGVRVVA